MKATILHLVKTARLSYTTSTQVLLSDCMTRRNFPQFHCPISFFPLSNFLFFFNLYPVVERRRNHKSPVGGTRPVSILQIHQHHREVFPHWCKTKVKKKADHGENQIWFTTKQKTKKNLLKNVKPGQLRKKRKRFTCGAVGRHFSFCPSIPSSPFPQSKFSSVRNIHI